MRNAREIEVAVAVGALFALAAVAGCAPDETRFPATTGCEGTLCGKPPPGGGTVGKDGGAEGGAAVALGAWGAGQTWKLTRRSGRD